MPWAFPSAGEENMNNQAILLILQSYSHIYLISRKSMNTTLFKNVSLKDI